MILFMPRRCLGKKSEFVKQKVKESYVFNNYMDFRRIFYILDFELVCFYK